MEKIDNSKKAAKHMGTSFDKNLGADKHEETLGETLKTVFYALVLAMLIRTFGFAPFKIPSGSMYPTLEVGDFLFVSKYTYGYSKHSFPFSFPNFEGRFWADLPKRGDVVVFKYPGDNSTDYIKRITGLPGDTIQVKNGRLHINGKVTQREKVGLYVIDEYTPFPQKYTEYKETLPEGKEIRILEYADDVPTVDNTPEFKIPAGYYFMMGDNRDNSNDSRQKVGLVPFENIEGKARFLFYSHDDTIRWYDPLSWITSIRWERMFNLIK